jgi:PAS domain-containing protein
MRLADAGTGGPGGAQDRMALAMVMDTIDTQVIMTDADLNIVRMNIAARHAMLVSEEDARGMPLDRALVDPSFHFILRAVERVRETGVSENFELDTMAPPLRTFRVQVECFGEGMVIFAHDITAQTQVRQRHAIASAYEELMDALPGLARGTINARGIISSASPALAELVQTDPGRITGMRIASLFHTSERGAVSDAVERLLGERRAFTMETSLQTGGMTTAPVMLSAVPSSVHARDEDATFLLQRHEH